MTRDSPGANDGGCEHPVYFWGTNMASAHPPLWRQTVQHGARRSGALIAAMAITGVAISTGLALASYQPGDPSLSTAAGGPVGNMLGRPGAMIADALLALLGWPVTLTVPFALLFASRLWRDRPVGAWRRMSAKVLIGILLIATGFSLVDSGAVSTLPAGYGGALALGIAAALQTAIGQIGDPVAILWTGRVLAGVAMLGGVMVYALGFEIEPGGRKWSLGWPRGATAATTERDVTEDEAAPHRPEPAPRPIAVSDPRPAPVITDRPAKPATTPAKPPRQTSFDLGDTSALPPVDLLKPAPPTP
ncbi:MAG: cell division protein FtsK, partial [Sphingomonas sp.]|nr:cell division protein FtsK [Sphingomonas sp.]